MVGMVGKCASCAVLLEWCCCRGLISATDLRENCPLSLVTLADVLIWDPEGHKRSKGRCFMASYGKGRYTQLCLWLFGGNFHLKLARSTRAPPQDHHFSTHHVGVLMSSTAEIPNC